MLSAIYEYNWIKINDISDFTWDSYISLKEVWWMSWSDISIDKENIVDSHQVIDFPWFMEWRVITLSWWIIWKDEAKCLAKVSEMSRAFSVPSFYLSRLDWYKSLVFYRKWATDSEKFFINARMKKLPRFDKTLKIHRKRWFYLELFAEDPFFYSYLEKSHTFDWEYNLFLPNELPFDLIKSNTDIITHNWNCWAQTYFKITWKFLSIEIENITTSQKFTLSWVDIPNWEYIEIFGKDWKVYKNWIYDIAHDVTNNIWLSSNWIFLASWDNEIKFSWVWIEWDTPTCQIKYYDTYNNIEI